MVEREEFILQLSTQSVIAAVREVVAEVENPTVCTCDCGCEHSVVFARDGRALWVGCTFGQPANRNLMVYGIEDQEDLELFLSELPSKCLFSVEGPSHLTGIIDSVRGAWYPLN